MCILNVNCVSEVNRNQLKVYSAGKLSMCLKNFAWSRIIQKKKSNSSFRKCLSKALSFSPSVSGFQKLCIFLEEQPTIPPFLLSSLIEQMHPVLNCVALQLLCGESQTMVAVWFCGLQLPFKVSPIRGLFIAPHVAVWVSLCNC